jgi:3-dehydroquinate dehydratase/shikimate dehydrogenase
MSRICLTLTEKNLKSCFSVLNDHKHSIDLIELRVDYLEVAQLKLLNDFKFDKPTILTYRKTVDGGFYSGDEGYRLSVIKDGLRSGNFSFVDLEEDLFAPEIENIAKENGVQIIRSFHDFNGVPKDLATKLINIKRTEDEIPKAAVMIKSTSDLLEFYKEAFKIADEEKILLGMGPVGFNTRVLAAKIGSYLTFCSKVGSSAAPGHVSPSLLTHIYRFNKISKDTAVTGIIGNPVMHTKSPGIHNAGYTKLGMDFVYVPFETDDPKLFLEIASLLELKGFSVTVPFKSDIIEVLDSTTDSVKMIGACNTVTRINSKWIGENTDYVGFINPLLKSYGKLQGKKVSVIGAGGSAKASLYALKKEGAEVLILNRTVEKAKDLSEQFGVEYAALNSENTTRVREFSDVIIQNTNAGMHPLEDIDPLAFYEFGGSEFLYDIIYTPEVTKFLNRGADAGCKTLNGLEMLFEQGYRQFKLFTGFDYPKE